MQRRRTIYLDMLVRVAAALLFVTGLWAEATAQEVALVDLTQMTQRTDLRRPSQTSVTGGMASGTNESHACTDTHQSVGTLRTTLATLDHTQYQFGSAPVFEVTIENVGSQPLQIPISPNLADLQPADPSQKFEFSQLSVTLWIGGKRWNANMGGGIFLYGAANHPETLLSLHAGEWVRIIGKGKIELPLDSGVTDFIRAGDVINHANAQASVRTTTMQITALTAVSVSQELCITKLQGPAVVIEVSDGNQ
jgi:hypothetical protein